MSVVRFSVLVLFFVRTGLAAADPLSQESYQLSLIFVVSD
jgi:hypothetical protein